MSSTLELAAALRLTIARLARRFRQQSRGGLTPSQRSVVAVLARHGPMTMGSLADWEGISRPSATGIVSRLAEKGLVVRTEGPSDSRKSVVELTDLGHDRARIGREEGTSFLVPRLERLTDRELAILQDALPVLQSLLEDPE